MTPQPDERPGERPGNGQVADVDRALAALYREHYGPLVRMATLLVRDVATAEKLVQDSFVAMHGRWHRLGGSDRALSYLRESVVTRSRLVPHPRAAEDRNGAGPAPNMPTGEHGEHGVIALLELSAVVAALRTLPRRQREALVLRCYADLAPSQVAAAMGISETAVQGHTARAMTALHDLLEG